MLQVVILDKAAAQAATPDILAQHCIPHDRSQVGSRTPVDCVSACMYVRSLPVLLSAAGMAG